MVGLSFILYIYKRVFHINNSKCVFINILKYNVICIFVSIHRWADVRQTVNCSKLVIQIVEIPQ